MAVIMELCNEKQKTMIREGIDILNDTVLRYNIIIDSFNQLIDDLYSCIREYHHEDEVDEEVLDQKTVAAYARFYSSISIGICDGQFAHLQNVSDLSIDMKTADGFHFGIKRLRKIQNRFIRCAKTMSAVLIAMKADVEQNLLTDEKLVAYKRSFQYERSYSSDGRFSPHMTTEEFLTFDRIIGILRNK